MPFTMQIKDIKTTAELSDIVHKQKEPIFITKNGCSDLVVMSSELYDSMVRDSRINQAIYDAEREIENGGQAISLAEARSKLDKKYYG